MATTAAAETVSLKLQIAVDKKKNRVLFAEARKEFIDFIFHILALPLGAVVRILTETPSILGSIGTLREGLKNLDTEYIESPAQEYLLDVVKAPFGGTKTTHLLPQASCSKPTTFYLCSRRGKVFLHTCKSFGHENYPCSSVEVNIEATLIDKTVVQGSENGYAKGLVTFMVMDDLTVHAMTATSVVSTMNQLSIKDVGAVEKREVTFGTEEAIKLLKASLNSKTVLTDVFLSRAVKAE